MASHIRQYEALFLINPTYVAASWDVAKAEVELILQRANAEVIHLRKWDEKRLSYEIGGQKRGTYVLAFFKCEGPKVAGIERDVQLSENILRVLVIKADHLAIKDIDAMQPQQPVIEEHDTRSFRRGPMRDGPARERGPERDVIEEVPADIDAVASEKI